MASSGPRTRSASKDVETTDGISTVKEELSRFFNSEELKNTIRNAVFDALKDDLIGLKEVVDEAVKVASTGLQRRVQALETQCEELRAMINDNEQYSRKYNLRITGIDESDGENCIDKVINLCKTKLNTDIPKASFDRAHRVGRKMPGKARQVIVKLTHYHAKNAIYSKRKLLKGTQIFINDDLSRLSLHLLKEAKKNKNVKSAWSSDGKILAKDHNDKIHRIRKYSDILFIENDDNYD